MAWPTRATAEERWRLVRSRSALGTGWELIEVAILASSDECDDADAEVSALQNAAEAELNFPSDTVEGEGAAPSGSRSVEPADSGFGGSSAQGDSDDNLDYIDEPLTKRKRISTKSCESINKDEPMNTLGQENEEIDERTNAIAQLRSSVSMAPNNRALQSELLANLLFKLPADTHKTVTSELFLEIISGEARVVVNHLGK
ncbi:hypothetical protein QAD02_003302 [Eretmocerus hayati]|uniref:Uncharacterized protein n=1 Tax=Eretmocerus hayati TaxID=131215 RepID=A0ACC2NME7_9HYME|nr:hypothetical protein QAD02_003302 [Eretmocerus hayati]